MFDRIPDQDPVDAGRNGTETDLERLCRQYDGLLKDGLRTGAQALSDEAARELTALAAIYDLDVARPHELMWRDLRTVLVRQTRADHEAGAEGSPRIEARDLTLLVVEDDPQMAQDLTDALTDAGHRVVGPFHDGAAAEAAAGLYALDGALLDINLSGATDGVTLAARLKARWGVPVIFLSGDITAAARHAGLAEALVTKPYGRKDVLQALTRLSV